MAVMVKCPHCEKTFDRESEEFVMVGRRYVHVDCHEEYLKDRKKKKKPKTPLTQTQIERNELVSYIMEIYKMERPNGLVLKQIKDFSELGYSYVGMKSTLYYFHEVLGNPIIATGVGIIPFVYEEAKQWYRRKLDANKHFDGLVEDGLEDLTNKRVVQVNSRPMETRRRPKIDMTTL